MISKLLYLFLALTISIWILFLLWVWGITLPIEIMWKIIATYFIIIWIIFVVIFWIKIKEDNWSTINKDWKDLIW